MDYENICDMLKEMVVCLYIVCGRRGGGGAILINFCGLMDLLQLARTGTLTPLFSYQPSPKKYHCTMFHNWLNYTFAVDFLSPSL